MLNDIFLKDHSRVICSYYMEKIL